ncbi:MAG: malto-oligosyltrehalose synthase [Actinomycetota bacterium]|nr:malto-oligosyltrehalose synthase [Actinomycetota bacterium]
MSTDAASSPVTVDGARPGAAPPSTYRLQLHAGFDFAALAEQADYLAALGAGAVYLSPILQAAPGSTHGYDVVDHTRLSEDLGGAVGFARLRAALDRQGLRAVADVVPNHVAVPTPASLNLPFWSMLRDGPQSGFAHWFDVEWQALDEAGHGAVLAPVLGRHLADCLRDGEITVDVSGGPEGEAVVCYYDHRFPVRPGTESLPLPELLDRQWYRLAYWRVADEELNYRRFFDVNTLAALRVEDEDVFAETSAVLLAMVDEGALSGLRIDHPDGLADPRGYLQRLARGTSGGWVVVEKILEGEEQLPADWACAGTTGYEAVQRVGGVFVDPAGEARLTGIYTALTGEPATFAPVVEESKRWVVEHSLYAEVHRLVDVLVRICGADVLLRDHTRRALREALVELLVAFPVYRAYVAPGEEAPSASVAILEGAADQARAQLPEDRHATVELLRELALGRPLGLRGRDADRDEFVVRFQQTCGPVMAKGVEDTAFYRWFRLAALNEVGGDPAHFGVSPAALHDWCAEQARHWPGSMTTLSTHDTKRSEDVRARLAVLSELPEEWERAVTGWQAAAAAHRSPLLDANTEYLIWQTIVGAWPLDAGRLTAYLEKATREAKRHTSWTSPDEAYDDAVRGFAGAALADAGVRRQVEDFVRRIAAYTRVNVLGQKLLQLTVPGVPDVYQGSEVVSLALVDPDNRRPVDYGLRRALLAELDAGAPPTTLDAEKLLVTSRALRLRRERPAEFAGAYVPVAATSPHVVAFRRGTSVVPVVTRLAAGLARGGGWGDETLALPGGSWTDVLTGTSHQGGERALRELLRDLPVALLLRGESGG